MSEKKKYVTGYIKPADWWQGDIEFELKTPVYDERLNDFLNAIIFDIFSAIEVFGYKNVAKVVEENVSVKVRARTDKIFKPKELQHIRFYDRKPRIDG